MLPQAPETHLPGPRKGSLRRPIGLRGGLFGGTKGGRLSTPFSESTLPRAEKSPPWSGGTRTFPLNRTLAIFLRGVRGRPKQMRANPVDSLAFRSPRGRSVRWGRLRASPGAPEDPAESPSQDFFVQRLAHSMTGVLSVQASAASTGFRGGLLSQPPFSRLAPDNELLPSALSRATGMLVQYTAGIVYHCSEAAGLTGPGRVPEPGRSRPTSLCPSSLHPHNGGGARGVHSCPTGGPTTR